ncbi:MAG: hypothetical protein KAS32_28140 [Candidatus Peribacteraceae bacterium]|nr:hypothetical protein [Candidatus Peribacteraceae bacterium]
MDCFDILGEEVRRQFIDYPYAGCGCMFCETVRRARKEKEKETQSD